MFFVAKNKMVAVEKLVSGFTESLRSNGSFAAGADGAFEHGYFGFNILHYIY
jgi:hypothetical protein